MRPKIFVVSFYLFYPFLRTHLRLLFVRNFILASYFEFLTPLLSSCLLLELYGISMVIGSWNQQKIQIIHRQNLDLNILFYTLTASWIRVHTQQICSFFIYLSLCKHQNSVYSFTLNLNFIDLLYTMFIMCNTRTYVRTSVQVYGLCNVLHTKSLRVFLFCVCIFRENSKKRNDTVSCVLLRLFK